MRRVVTTVLAPALTLGALGVAAPAMADAQQPAGPTTCVSHTEFTQAEKGMSAGDVRTLFGTTRAGFDSPGAGVVRYYYRSCDGHHGAVMTYTLGGRYPHNTLSLTGKRWTLAG